MVTTILSILLFAALVTIVLQWLLGRSNRNIVAEQRQTIIDLQNDYTKLQNTYNDFKQVSSALQEQKNTVIENLQNKIANKDKEKEANNETDFINLKQKILEKAKAANACENGYQEAEKASNIDELINVVKKYLSFVVKNNIITRDIINDTFYYHFYSGKNNTGLFNSGDSNSGDWNSGDWNSGDWNSGDWNSGNRNSGHFNSGDRNSGHWNSGDWNSGNYSNGIFCTKEAFITSFNKKSNMKMSDYITHPAYKASLEFKLTGWIKYKDMTEDEKQQYPNAKTTEGYLKKYEYKEACKIWWSKLTDDEKNSFKTLPNFDAKIFFEITGIAIEKGGAQ